jgi:hypothetical protein
MHRGLLTCGEGRDHPLGQTPRFSFPAPPTFTTISAVRGNGSPRARGLLAVAHARRGVRDAVYGLSESRNRPRRPGPPRPTATGGGPLPSSRPSLGPLRPKSSSKFALRPMLLPPRPVNVSGCETRTGARRSPSLAPRPEGGGRRWDSRRRRRRTTWRRRAAR